MGYVSLLVGRTAAQMVGGGAVEVRRQPRHRNGNQLVVDEGKEPY